MNSLETRVYGLEMALDEISYDLAVSSGRIPNSDAIEDMCCKLPGTDFLSSKFWKKTENRYEGGYVVNPLAEIQSDLKGRSGHHSYKMSKNVVRDAGNAQGNRSSA